LYIGKEDGLWWLDESVAKQFTLAIKDVPDQNNLQAITSQGETVFFGYGDSFGYMTAGQHKDLLNYRAGYDGLPSNRTGYISAAITVLGWVTLLKGIMKMGFPEHVHKRAQLFKNQQTLWGFIIFLFVFFL